MKIISFVRKTLLTVGGIVSFVSLVSCDSREDWFAKNGEGATIVVKTSKFPGTPYHVQPESMEIYRCDTITPGDNKLLVYDVKLSDVLESSPGWLYLRSEKLHFDISGYGIKSNKSLYITDISYNSDNESPRLITNEISENDFRNLGFGGSTASLSQTLRSDTAATLLNSSDIYLHYEDVFGNKNTFHVKLHFWGDVPPIPVLDVENVDGNPMEKTLSMKGSYDKDGSIVKYEYCIDGNVITSYGNGTYDADTYARSGEGAYGGTYITATSLDEVKHAFQTAGEHTIYYRCMDNVGVWSAWKKKTINL